MKCQEVPVETPVCWCSVREVETDASSDSVG